MNKYAYTHGVVVVNYIQVPVPEEHVPRVIALLADLNRGIADRAGGEGSETASLDEALVTRMYFDSEERHRDLMSYLASRPGEWVFTSELADALNMPTGTKGMAGVFGAFGRRAKHRYGGAKPWEMAWDPARGEAKYRMDPKVAKWVGLPF
jgi:Family of unknown function (DUF6416)